MDNQTGTTAFEKASAAAQNGRFDEAEKLLAGILVETPTHEEAQTLSFAVAMRRRDFAVARKRAEAALVLLPDNPTVLSNLGAALIQAGEYDDAKTRLDTAIKSAPKLFSPRYNRALLHVTLGQFAEAVDDLTVAADAEPNRADVQMALADALIESGQFDKAATHIREMARLGIGAPVHRAYHWGRLLYFTGRYNDARKPFAEVLSAAPDEMAHYRALAATRFQCGDWERAKTLTRAAFERFPKNERSDGTPALRVLVLEAFGADCFTGIDRHPIQYTQGNFPAFLPAGRIAYTHVITDVFDDLGDVLDLSHYDIALNNRSVFERIDARGQTERFDRMTAALPMPVINTPAATKHATREGNSLRFANAERFTFPHTLRISHEADADATRDRILKQLSLPIILRPLHTHSGHGVSLLQDEKELSEILTLHPLSDFYAIAYHDCQSEDGLFRRYRLACVDGKLRPCGMHVGSDWNVHGEGRDTVDWVGLGLDKEEIAFHEAPETVLGGPPEEVFREITDTIDLDIYGIDFGFRREGGLIVYEINAAMGLSLAGARMGAGYRAPYKTEVIRSIEACLFNRAGKSLPPDQT